MCRSFEATAKTLLKPSLVEGGGTERIKVGRLCRKGWV